MRKRRARLKEDAEVYEDYRSKERKRLQNLRKNLSPEQIAKNREASRLRMVKMRQIRKQNCKENETNNTNLVRKTRLSTDQQQKQRESWKLKKREQRLNMSFQKKRRIREKDAKEKKCKRALLQEKNSTEDYCSSNDNLAFPSDAAKRQALCRVKSSFPKKSSVRYAVVVANLIKTASPKKVAALKEHGVEVKQQDQDILACVRKSLKTVKRSTKRQFVSNIASILDQKHGLKKKASKCLGISWNFLMKYSKLKKKNADVDQRKKRSDATPASTIDAIHDHYERPDMSTILPNRKSIAQGQPKHVLQRSVEATFKSFTNDNPSLKISESTFNKLRPKHILLQSKSKFYQCLCEPCTNIDLKLKVLNHEVYQCQSTSCSIRDRYHATDLTLCPKDQNPHAKLECIDRKCEICDVDLLDHYLQPLLNVSGDKDVSWEYWGQATYGNEGKKRVALLRSSGTVKQLVDQLKEELISLSTHLFIARWQQNVFYTITKNPPTNSIVMVMDFAENYLCVMQNEAQSAHWYQMQVKEINENGYYLLQYMEKVKDNVYKWPINVDVSTESPTSIVRQLPLPILLEHRSNTRIQFYSF
ncbi:hypothetical protein LOTGIDRAFT_152749 [Lottia gigantea]|uniref:Uncharacterized protein n=1 Tax=Lottia gigantea TaxID=225164 RepID=V4A1F7_LOTGI|nr:hypothetical protein LOTGIDRAFT_152749 [Lottia gigantea]ESO97658.1 hypothetical protein LOTGIDRAFT_152749 [Lottia gigantea]